MQTFGDGRSEVAVRLGKGRQAAQHVVGAVEPVRDLRTVVEADRPIDLTQDKVRHVDAQQSGASFRD